MNKYQESLDRVETTENVDVKKLGKEIVKIVRSGHLQDCKTLQELVDKATPKKPLNIITTQFGLSIGDCPICKETVVQGNGCAKCLQAIDWNKDE